MYSMQKYIILHHSTNKSTFSLHHSQWRIDEGTKPFCFSEWYGTGHMFAYHKLFTSWESRGGGRRWCKQLSSWEILLSKNFLSENGKSCAQEFALLRLTWKENGIEMCYGNHCRCAVVYTVFASFLSDMHERGHWVILVIFVEMVAGNMQVAI